MTVVPLAPQHVDEVARLHCESLTGLLSTLGPQAARLFYAGCVGNERAIGLVYVGAGEVLGFALGTAQPATLKGEVLRTRPLGWMAAIAAAVCRRPRSLRWIVDGWRGPRGRFDEGAAELTYLAVASDRRRGGVGRRLVDAFTAAMTSQGARAYELSVDDDNAGAVSFYENLGFQLVGRYRQYGDGRRRYRLDLSIGSPPCP